MPLFRVRPGMRHGAGKIFGPGDVVELTVAEAQGFLDKLERVEDAPPAPADVEETIDEAAAVEEAAESDVEADEAETPESETGDADEAAPDEAETPKRRGRK